MSRHLEQLNLNIVDFTHPAARRWLQVGLLDIDICGPSIPKMLGLEGEEIHHSNAGWSPVYVDDNLGVMSIGEAPAVCVICWGVCHQACNKQLLVWHWSYLDVEGC